jgi:hypothetical protein
MKFWVVSEEKIFPFEKKSITQCLIILLGHDLSNCKAQLCSISLMDTATHSYHMELQNWATLVWAARLLFVYGPNYKIELLLFGPHGFCLF